MRCLYHIKKKSPPIHHIRYLITNPQDNIQSCLLRGMQWDETLFYVLMYYVVSRPVRHFVNVGCHVGTLCLPLSKYVRQVTAFEAYPPTYRLFLRNMKYNHITNIQHYNMALGNHQETIYFFSEDKICSRERINRFRKNTGGMHVLRQYEIDHHIRSSHLTDKKVQGFMNRLDDMDIDPFDLLLVDIEGMEYEFLLGAQSKIRLYKPILVIEIWSNLKRQEEKMTTTSEHVIDLILSFGYQLVHQYNDDYVFEPRSSAVLPPFYHSLFHWIHSFMDSIKQMFLSKQVLERIGQMCLNPSLFLPMTFTREMGKSI